MSKHTIHPVPAENGGDGVFEILNIDSSRFDRQLLSLMFMLPMTPERALWWSEKVAERLARDRKTVDDGFGSAVSVICPECKQATMQVVRPGSFQCSKCG